MDAPRITAIATDVDGTLTGPSRGLSLRAVRALRRAEEKGFPVLLVSGNVLPVLWGLSNFIGTSGPLVAENGGVVFHAGEVRVLADRGPALEAWPMLRDRLGATRVTTDRWRESGIALRPDVDPEDVKRLLEGSGLEVQPTGFAHHISVRGTDKGSGLRVALEMAGIDPGDVMVFGDHENDIPMFRMAGLSVAVGNAQQRLKAVAKYICVEENGKGVQEALERFLFR